jgi:hypothetical protein
MNKSLVLAALAIASLFGAVRPSLASQNFTLGVEALYGKPFHSPGLSGRVTDDWGGEVRGEWQALPMMSLGLAFGQTALYTESAPYRQEVGSLDVTGRLISPLEIGMFQPFLLGAVGYNTFTENSAIGHYHGQAEAGVRMALNNAFNFDLGAAYNFFSPVAHNTNMADLRAGINYAFGAVPETAGAETSNVAAGQQAVPEKPMTEDQKLVQKLLTMLDSNDENQVQSLTEQLIAKGPEAAHSASEAVDQDRVKPDVFKGDFEDAERAAEVRTKLEPDSASGYQTLGVIEWYLGNPKKTVSYFKKALKLDPSRTYLKDMIKRTKKAYKSK